MLQLAVLLCAVDEKSEETMVCWEGREEIRGVHGLYRV
jgi:hypothetical protein